MNTSIFLNSQTALQLGIVCIHREPHRADVHPPWITSWITRLAQTLYPQNTFFFDATFQLLGMHQSEWASL